jgi:hypothetical protein
MLLDPDLFAVLLNDEPLLREGRDRACASQVDQECLSIMI